MFILLYCFFLLQNEVTILAYDISDGKVCDIIVSKNRGTLIKFHASALSPKCKGLVRFKQENATYCIPIIDGKNDILHCPVSTGCPRKNTRLWGVFSGTTCRYFN